MYIQITTKCNMKCGHCCYSATSKGQHMSREIWKQAIKVACDLDGTVSVGGGEPTLHPEFWEIMGLAMGLTSEYVWLATNGSNTETSIALARLAQKGVIGCALSRDEWHDPIDPKVVEAFTKKPIYGSFDNRTPDAREIRTIKEPYRSGRWKKGKKECVCSDLFVQPDGTVRGCGCANAPTLGNIFDFKVPENYEYGECSLEREKGVDKFGEKI